MEIQTLLTRVTFCFKDDYVNEGVKDKSYSFKELTYPKYTSAVNT